MSNTLTKDDFKRLRTLGAKIRLGLGCDANSIGVPCATDRLESVRYMKQYLKIHDIKVIR